jgi:acetyl-CoA carboxylase carboxyltransferase component
VTALATAVDPAGSTHLANREAMLERLAELDSILDEVRAGGGEKYVERHRKRGKMLVRERVELLLDRDAPFLEVGPFVGWGTGHKVGGSVVAGIGVVEGVECMIIGHAATVRGGSMNNFSWTKIARALEIAAQNRLPTALFVESGGADLPNQLDLFIPGGRLFRDVTRLSGDGIPTVALVFGNSTAGGAYLPAMCDYTILVKERAKVFLGGPPLVKVATGEDSSEEELGGAEMHSRISGLSDYMAQDEADAIRIGRDVIRRLNWRKQGPGPTGAGAPPVYDVDELLGIASADPKVPFDPREIVARIVDGSDYDEFKPLYGSALTTGWASIHGYPVGILANVRGVLFSEEAQKAAQFIQLANRKDVPLLFVHNTTGFMVGKEYEQGGIIKDGAKMINAVSNSEVPHLGLIVGASYGAAHYAMSGRAYNPRLLFSWPSALSAVMGPDQLAGVMSIIARAAAESAGRPFDEAANKASEDTIRDQIEREQVALAVSARGYDDGIIDPRDSRTVLGIALSACHGRDVRGADGFGVFRM